MRVVRKKGDVWQMYQAHAKEVSSTLLLSGRAWKYGKGKHRTSESERKQGVEGAEGRQAWIE